MKKEMPSNARADIVCIFKYFSMKSNVSFS